MSGLKHRATRRILRLLEIKMTWNLGHLGKPSLLKISIFDLFQFVVVATFMPFALDRRTTRNRIWCFQLVKRLPLHLYVYIEEMYSGYLLSDASWNAQTCATITCQSCWNSPLYHLNRARMANLAPVLKLPVETFLNIQKRSSRYQSR